MQPVPPASLERAYRMFVRCHHIVADASSERELCQWICRAAVDELGYKLAWIGLLEPQGSRVVPVAHAGYEDGYLESIVITATDDEHGRGPTGTAIRNCHVSVARDIASDPHFLPWRADALARGYASSVAIPLCDGPRVLGALNLYATEPDAFDEREIALLEEVALDVLLGLLRRRAARVEERLEAHLDEGARLEAANAVATAVAHDLQNMLQVVSLGLAELRARIPSELAAGALEDATAATRAASSLTGQILALARRGAPGAASVDVDVCLRALAPLLGRLARSSSCIELDLAAGPGRVRLAPIDLERIAINMTLNAAQAAGRSVMVRIATSPQEITPEAARPDLPAGRYVAVEITDDGPGIAASVLPRVFEPFFTTKAVGGTGLGLASAAQIVRAAGGTISVASEEGHGARFTLLLPRAEA